MILISSQFTFLIANQVVARKDWKLLAWTDSIIDLWDTDKVLNQLSY